MKKIQNLTAALLSAALLAGCSAPAASDDASAQTAQTAQSDKLHIVTTIFPVYDWVREVAGPEADAVELTMLLDGGTDLHSYQPAARDMVEIADCDLFVYVGGESDAWVADALQESPNPDRKVLNLMELLGSRVYEEETVEGMEAEDHDHEAGGATPRMNISGLRCATRQSFPRPLPMPWRSWTPPTRPATPPMPPPTGKN